MMVVARCRDPKAMAIDDDAIALEAVEPSAATRAAQANAAAENSRPPRPPRVRPGDPPGTERGVRVARASRGVHRGGRRVRESRRESPGRDESPANLKRRDEASVSARGAAGGRRRPGDVDRDRHPPRCRGCRPDARHRAQGDGAGSRGRVGPEVRPAGRRSVGSTCAATRPRRIPASEAFSSPARSGRSITLEPRTRATPTRGWARRCSTRRAATRARPRARLAWPPTSARDGRLIRTGRSRAWRAAAEVTAAAASEGRSSPRTTRAPRSPASVEPTRRRGGR